MPIHKSFIGKAIGKAVTTFVPGANTAVDIFKTGRSFLGGGGGGGRSFGRAKARPTVPRAATARVTVTSQAERELGKRVKFPEMSFAPGGGGGSSFPVGFGSAFHENGNGAGPCEPPLRRSPQGNCIFPGSPRGAEVFMGEPILGQYGAGRVAGSQIVDRAVCGRGMQLGNDGICYNKKQITNKERMWPAGRKPLLSGGDMRAISTAARAGRRMDLATARLRKLGMMKKAPAARKPAAHQHAKAATGVVSV